MKAVAYLRVSGHSQIDGEGFGRQQEAINAYAKAHDIEIVGTYREEAVPGKTEMQNRPAFVAMLEYLASDGVNLVLIEKLDRLARDLMVQETIIRDLQNHGFELISVREPDLLQNDPSRKLMRQIFGAMAEYEKDMLVAKLWHARKRVRERGEYQGGRLGYGKTVNRPTAHEMAQAAHERMIMARVKELRAQGYTFQRIANTITAEGFLPRSGKLPWSLSLISRICQAPPAALSRET